MCFRHRVMTVMHVVVMLLRHHRSSPHGCGGDGSKQTVHGRARADQSLEPPPTGESIRFYWDEGLLEPTSSSQSRNRRFNEQMFAELALISRLRAMDLPLVNVAYSSPPSEARWKRQGPAWLSGPC
ncbi:MerR family transcriptional regulator [Synechococcus sp. A10-1-5-1]|uniref:MerR family transcriptional regulator n=1 Tax=Synechococcus sp. A10-1-5-1 TaxID=2936507 RepID=UPI0035304274